jgi:hypothetical protein
MNRQPIHHPKIEKMRAISVANGFWQVQRFDGSIPDKRVMKKNGKEILVPFDRWYNCGPPKAQQPAWGQA